MENEELKKIIKNRELKPSDLFDRLELRWDPVMKKEIDLAVEFERHSKKVSEEMKKEEDPPKKKDPEDNDLIPDPEGDLSNLKDDDGTLIPD